MPLPAQLLSSAVDEEAVIVRVTPVSPAPVPTRTIVPPRMYVPYVTSCEIVVVPPPESYKRIVEPEIETLAEDAAVANEPLVAVTAPVIVAD